MKRIASMTFLELFHRILEQYKRLTSRFYTPVISNNYNTKPLPTLPSIRDGLLSLANDHKLIRDWQNLSNHVTRNEFSCLGVQWSCDNLKDMWHFDPISKKNWPCNTYCFDINYRSTDSYGDVKYVWELNRLQHLQPLAALAKINKDDQLAKYCLDTIEHWIDQNPPYKGINWTSGIELAFRTISIFVVISFIDASLFTDSQVKKFHNTLACHGYWLMRYPSRFSSANNHLVAEAAALYLLGALAPYMPNAGKWKKYGRRILTNEALKQIYPDGVGAEQSPSYTSLTLEWFLLCGKVGKELNDEFPTQFWQRVEKAGEFLYWLTDKNGNQPNIGDNDESQVIYSKTLSISYITSILSCIANLTNRQDLVPRINTHHLRYSIFGKPNLRNQSLIGTNCYGQGGYTISRYGTKNKEYLLVFDHGSLGYLNIAAHGHADALAIWLHIDGFPVIVDAGTYLYHSGGKWRDHMRSTSAHNTLSIKGENSSLIAGTFNWSSKAKTVLVDYKVTDNKVFVCAENNGYQKRFGVKHRRQIQKNDDDSFIVTDSLHGKTTELPVEIGFLFHPDLSIYKTNNIWVVFRNQNPILEIEYDNDSFDSSVKLGQQNPMRGWYSKYFGHVIPAPRLQFEGKLKTDHTSRIHIRPI